MLQTRKKSISTALALALTLSSINLAWANVAFVKFADGYAVNPGDPVVVRWTEVLPPNATVANNDPFNLLLRALTGQSYVIQRGVAQNLLTVTINIPKNATGGLHSFRADYTGTGGVSSNQLTVTGNIVTTTTLPPTTMTTTTTSTTGTPLTSGEGNKESSGGLSGGALGGIIGGVVALLLLIALIFFFRHRRRVREHSGHSKLNDNKENYGHLSSRDGSVAMTSRSMNGPGPIEPPPQGTNISGPLSVAPNYEKQRPSRDDHSGPHSPQHMQHQGKNPFEEDRPLVGGATSLSPRQQHQPYQPPQMSQPPPRPYQQGPPYNNNNNDINNNQQGYTLPPHQQDRASPFLGSRDSFESEVESAYDPRVNVNQHGAPAPMMRGGPPMMNGPGLSHSPSGRSNMSDPRLRQGQPMSPAQHHQQQLQLQQQRQAGSMSPVTHRPMTPTNYHHQDPENRSHSPFAGTSRQREIEMQPLDIQQHQLEQQQRVLQRQQQQQQQQQQQLQQQEQQQEQQREQQNQHQVPPLSPVRTTLSPFNPTQYDDKTEIDDDGVPVYNGYRDTIFGAYAQTPEDDEDESDDDRAKVPTPTIPASAMALAGHETQLKQDNSLEMNGATGVQRKKSVKFTGVPASGPIVVPQAQQGQTKHNPLDAADDREEEEEDEDGYYDDEDDIKLRMMETEVPSPTVSNASANRPAFINTTPGVGSPVLSNNSTHPVLSPVRSLASPTSPYQQQPVSKTSPTLDTSSPFGNGFYEDVLAAVDNHGVTSPVSPRNQHQQQLPTFPTPVPRSPESNQHHVPQQHLPPPQTQHLTKEVYGAPSPRMTPASAHQQQQQQQQQQHNGNQGPPSPSSARVMSPRSAARQPHNNHGRDDEESAFYESQLL